MKHIMLLAPTLLMASVASQKFTQYNSYSLDQCRGQPITMYSMSTGLCQIPGTQSNTCTSYPNSLTFSSQKTICTDQPLDLTGIVQVYVAKYSWTGSSKCEGSPSSVEATVGDAGCHPMSADAGAVKQWMSVNCNGGKPIIKTCRDAGCSSCEQYQYTGQCDSLGAGASVQALCYWPSRNGGGTTRFDDSEDSADTIKTGVMVALPALAGLMML